jgi:F-type H+-transporting ATPase subunit delta
MYDLVELGKADANQLNGELAAVSAALRTAPLLAAVLATPRVDPARKLAVVDELSKRLRLSHYVRNLIAVTIRRGRVAALPQIQEAFAHIVREQQGFVKLEVASARRLEADERAALERQFAAMTGRKIEPVYTEDVRLLGGFIARLGDTVYDASVRGQLHRLRLAIVAGQ